MKLNSVFLPDVSGWAAPISSECNDEHLGRGGKFGSSNFVVTDASEFEESEFAFDPKLTSGRYISVELVESATQDQSDAKR